MIQSTLHALSAAAADRPAEQSTVLLSDGDRLPHDAQADVLKIVASRSFAPRVISTAARPLGAFPRDVAPSP